MINRESLEARIDYYRWCKRNPHNLNLEDREIDIIIVILITIMGCLESEE